MLLSRVLKEIPSHLEHRLKLKDWQYHMLAHRSLMECKIGHITTLENILLVFSRIRCVLQYGPAITLLSIYSGETKNVSIQRFIFKLFIDWFPRERERGREGGRLETDWSAVPLTHWLILIMCHNLRASGWCSHQPSCPAGIHTKIVRQHSQQLLIEIAKKPVWTNDCGISIPGTISNKKEQNNNMPGRLLKILS